MSCSMIYTQVSYYEWGLEIYNDLYIRTARLAVQLLARMLTVLHKNSAQSIKTLMTADA